MIDSSECVPQGESENVGERRAELGPEDAAFDAKHLALTRELWEDERSFSEVLLAKLEDAGLREGGVVVKEGSEVRITAVEERTRNRPQGRRGVVLPGGPIREGYCYHFSDGTAVETKLGSDDRLRALIHAGVSVGEYSLERLEELLSAAQLPVPPKDLERAFSVDREAERDPATYRGEMVALGRSVDEALIYLSEHKNVGPRELQIFVDECDVSPELRAFLHFTAERARQMSMSTQLLAERLTSDPDTQRVFLREFFALEHSDLGAPFRVSQESLGVAVSFDDEDDYLSAYAGYMRASQEEHERVRESVRGSAGLATLGNRTPRSGPMRHFRGYVTLNRSQDEHTVEEIQVADHERQHKLNYLLMPEREVGTLRNTEVARTVSQAKDEIIAHIAGGEAIADIEQKLASRDHPFYSYWALPLANALEHGTPAQVAQFKEYEREHIETVRGLIAQAKTAQEQGVSLTTLALTPWTRWEDLAESSPQG